MAVCTLPASPAGQRAVREWDVLGGSFGSIGVVAAGQQRVCAGWPFWSVSTV